MKISTRGRYALEAVLDLAIHSNSCHDSLGNIARRRNISENYLEQIFIDLKKNGIVQSIRGAKGGYILAKSASLITCGEIIRSVEKKVSPVACVAEGKERDECSRYENCVSRILWEDIRKGIDDISNSITIGDLLIYYKKIQEAERFEYHI